MIFNIFNAIILAGIVQGLVFSSVLLFHKKYTNRPNTFLAFTVLSLSLSNLQYLLLDVEIINRNYLRIPTEFLILPMFYFFVQEYLFKTEIKLLRKPYFFSLLILPFLLSLILHFFIYWNYDILDKSFIVYHANLDELSALFFSITVILMLWSSVKSFDKVNISAPERTGWLKRLLLIGLTLCIFWSLELSYFNLFDSIGIDSYYPLWVSISVLIYWISYESLFQVRLANARRLIRNKKIPKGSVLLNSSYDFHNIIVEKELFLNPQFSLIHLSEQTGYSTNYLSKLLREQNKGNFKEVVNRLRVERAKQLLISKEFENYTITAIGLESGFNSRSSFFQAYKQITGETPSTYKKRVQKNTKTNKLDSEM